jgi:hypothetical protein
VSLAIYSIVAICVGAKTPEHRSKVE